MNDLINPNYSQIKLIFLDVDGVIAKDLFTPVTPEMLDLLTELGSKYKVSLCTGRNYPDTQAIIVGAKLENNFHILETGTRVLNPGGGYAYEHFLTIRQIIKILEVAKKFTDNFGFCQNGAWLDSIDKLNGDTFSIFSINTFNPNDTRSVLEAISRYTGDLCVSPMVSSFDPNGHHVHITNSKASKGFGTKYVRERLSLNKENCLGVGDSSGDLPMLNECGVKVVMGNADDEVKTQGDIVIGDFADDGLIEFIKSILLVLQ